MKILHVIPFFPPAWAWGGPVVVAHELCKGLLARGHQVTVYTTDTLDPGRRIDVPDAKPVDLDGIEVRYFRNTSNWLAGKHHLQFSPGLFGVARKEMKRFDVVHLHGFRTFQNLMVYPYMRENGIPYVLHAHGTLFNTPPKQSLKAMYDLFGHSLIRNASALIALNNTEAEVYEHKGGSHSRVVLLPNAINEDEFRALPARNSFRRRYGVGESEALVLYLGRIHADKGIDLLVDSFGKVLEEVPAARLAVVGPDDGNLATLRARIRQLGIAGDRILLTGPIYGRDRFAAFRDADLFVTPSYFGFPVTFVEACACGVPIITTTKGDALDWIQNNVGYVVSYDSKKLASAIVRVLNSPGEREQFAANGRQLVRERFNWDVVTKSLEEIYLRALPQ